MKKMFERILRKNSLKSKFTRTLLAVSLVPLVLVSSLSIFEASKSMTKQVADGLMSTATSRANAIEAYGQQIAAQITTLANNGTVVDATEQLSLAFDKFLEQSETLDIDAKREAVGDYYRDEFQRVYRESNGSNAKIKDWLKALSPEAIALQHAYISQNTAALGSKHQLMASPLGTDYDDLHAELHPYLKNYLETFGYYDIFLADNSGRIVYSVFKELDYATNVFTGPFSNTDLANAVKAGLQSSSSDDYTLLDFKQYPPSYEAPASFISAPLFNNGSRVGALVFQMPLDRITAVMSERAGLGDTGEAFLVGSDQRLRSDTYKNPVDYNVANGFRKNIRVKSEAIEEVLEGRKGNLAGLSYSGDSVLSSYVPVVFGNLEWGMIAEIEQQEAFAIVTLLKWQMVATVLVAIVVVTLIARFFASSFIKPINAMRSAMIDITESGDFSRRVEVYQSDEIGQSGNAFNSLLKQLESVVAEVTEVVNQLAKGDFGKRVDAPLNGNLNDLKLAVNQSCNSIQDTMKALSGSIEALEQGDMTHRLQADLLGKFNEFGGHVDQAMRVNDRAFREIRSVISGLADGDFSNKVEGDYPGVYGELTTSLNAMIDVLEKSVRGIQESSCVVRGGARDIATGNANLSTRTEKQAGSLEQTAASMDEISTTVQQTAQNANRANELALEAQDNAIRGGDVVRKAVKAMEDITHSSSRIAEIIGVIDEIAFQTNLLALNASVEAARAGEQGRGFAVVASEVRNLAGRSATAAKEIKELIEDSVKKVNDGTQMVSASGETLEQIVERVSDVTSIVGEITTAAGEQSTGISEIHRAMSELQRLTQQNTAMVEEAAASSEALGGQAATLDDAVAFFKFASDAVSRTEETTERRSASRPWGGNSASKPEYSLESTAKAVGAEDDWSEF